jgi:hypothetical protein
MKIQFSIDHVSASKDLSCKIPAFNLCMQGVMGRYHFADYAEKFQ